MALAGQQLLGLFKFLREQLPGFFVAGRETATQELQRQTQYRKRLGKSSLNQVLLGLHQAQRNLCLRIAGLCQPLRIQRFRCGKIAAQIFGLGQLLVERQGLFRPLLPGISGEQRSGHPQQADSGGVGRCRLGLDAATQVERQQLRPLRRVVDQRQGTVELFQNPEQPLFKL